MSTLAVSRDRPQNAADTAGPAPASAKAERKAAPIDVAELPPPSRPYSHAQPLRPKIGIFPLLEPFVGFVFHPTGFPIFDYPIDWLTKIVASPLLLLCGLIDTCGGRVFDYFKVLAFKASLQGTGAALDFDIAYFRHRNSEMLSESFARLARAGLLLPILQGLDGEHREQIQVMMRARLVGPTNAAWILNALLNAGSQLDEDLTDAVLNRVWAKGFLPQTLDLLRQMRPNDPQVDALADRARDVEKPLIGGHRGYPKVYFENSIESDQAAMDNGADFIETDLCITKDGKVVVWHDDDPNSIVGLLREAGLEPDQAYHPVVPAIGSQYRRPVHTLLYSEWKGRFGFRPHGDGGMTPMTDKIPSVEELGNWGVKMGAKLKKMILDTKLPEDCSDELIAAYAKGITEAFGALSEQSVVMVMSPYPKVLAKLKQDLAGTKIQLQGGNADATEDAKFSDTYDTILQSFIEDPAKVTAIRDGVAMGNDNVSIGVPRIPSLVSVDNQAAYMEVLYRARDDIKNTIAGHPTAQIGAWTLDSPEQITDGIGTGRLSWFLTDDTPLARKVVDGLFAPKKPKVKNPLQATQTAPRLAVAPSPPKTVKR